MYKFGHKSLNNLVGVHKDLVSVVSLAIKLTTQDFSVIEGLRSLERQKTLYKNGKSKTMSSRHLNGFAVDLAPFPFNGDIDKDGVYNISDWDQYYPIADAMISASRQLGIPLRWGGNWSVSDLRDYKGSAVDLAKGYSGNFPDGPHFELPRGFY